MDSASQVRGRGARVAVAALILISLAACGRSNTVAPAAVPAPVVAEHLPATIEEAKALEKQGKLDLYERALQALSLASDATTRRRAQTLLALDLVERKAWSEAIPALRIAAAGNPVIAPYLELRVADADEALDHLPQAIATASAIVATAPASSAAAIARLRLPGLYAAVSDATNMDAALQQAAAIPVDELTEADFVNLAARLDKSGYVGRAEEIRMRILRENTDGRYTEPVYSTLAAAKPSPLDALPTDEATALASSLARADHYDQALDLLQRIGSRADAATSDLYRTVRLRALYNSRNYGQLLKETENAQLDAPLQLMRARAAWRDDKPQEFLAGLTHIESEFTDSPQATEAKLLRAKYYTSDEIDYQKAVDNLRDAIARGATGTDGENIWTLGWTYTVWGRYDDALQTLDRYEREYPDGAYKTNALFWTGKIQEKLGNKDARDAAWTQLINEWPFDYYSYRAKELMGGGQAPSPVATGEAPVLHAFPDLDAALATVIDPRIAAVRELVAVDMNRDATREMREVAAAYRDNPGIDFMLADVYAAGGEPFAAIGIIQRSFREFVRHGGTNIPQRLWQILYPLQYWDNIRTEAQRRDIDPYLVASIIRQESGFEPTVVSNAGAVGLMQIMPGEASRIGEAAGIGSVTREQLFDPATNIAVGTAEYSQKLADMRGDPILAVAAYNAGEEPVGRWIAQTAYGDPDMFVESIPYAETRLYVKSVMRNRFEYRRVYESSIVSTEKPTSPGSHPRPQ